MNSDKDTIVFINDYISNNGVITLLLRKAKWLISNGYKVYLLTTNNGNLHHEFDKIGVAIICYDNIFKNLDELTFYEFLNFVSYITCNIKDINKIKVIETVSAKETIFGLMLAMFFNTKFIAGVYHPKHFLPHNPFPHNQEFKNLINILDKHNCILFMNSEVLCSHEEYYKITIKNKNILQLPIEIKKFRLNFDNNKEFIVISIGRLVGFKRYVYGLIKDFDEFYSVHRNSKLIIIGDGVEKDKVIKFAEKFNSYQAGKVKFLGEINYYKLDKYIYQASMGVAMGTSILEIASVGVPAVVAPGYTENNISNGLICDDGNNTGDVKNTCTKTYKEYMEYLNNCSKDEYYNIALQCRKKVEEKYSIDSVMNRWIEMVEECKQISLTDPLDELVEKTPFNIFSTLEKRKLKEKIKKIINAKG